MKFLDFTKTLSLVTILSLSGCGGSGGGSSSPAADTSTNIEVERGKVYQATVTDAAGNTATQVGSTNVYKFSVKPTMPVIASGGWIDVDGDGNMTASDIENDFNLSSYSYVVTPITTYLGDTSSDEGKARVQKLVSDMNVSEDDLTKVPSKSSKDGIALQNALYKVMKTKGSKLLDANDLADVNTSFGDLKDAIAQRPDLVDVTAIAKFAEQDIVDVLKNTGKAQALSTQKIQFFQDALEHIDEGQSLDEELEELQNVDTSAENQALSNHNNISIFHNITEAEKIRIEQAVYTASGSQGNFTGGILQDNGSSVVGDKLTYYELNRKTTCVSIGGFYDKAGKVTTTTADGVTKKVYKLDDKDHTAYCTEYIHSSTSDVYGDNDYAITYHKQNVAPTNVEEDLIDNTTSLSSSDLSYTGYVWIAPETYESTCTRDNQYIVSKGTYTCNDFTGTSNCQVNGITHGGDIDCITLSSDSYNGSTR